MSIEQPKLLVTGASGQLGRLVIDGLLKSTPAAKIAATVRNANAGASLREKGIDVHVADYEQPQSLDKAFAGVDRLLLISSSEVGRRVAQHLNVIAAAKRAGVKLFVYTSLLHADTSPLALAEEHRQTEIAIRDAGLPYVLLRNGWYTENYAGFIPAALEHGVLLGSAGDGRISSAARADYADAAAAALASRDDLSGSVYELAGDGSYTLADFAAELSRRSGKRIEYRNLPEAEFRAALIKIGLPEAIAQLLANSDAGAAKGGLFDDAGQLSRLICRPTTSLAASISAALRG